MQWWLGILVILSVLITNTQGQTLATIAANLQRTHHLNATTVGTTAASYVSLALLKSDFILDNITIDLTPTLLTVDAVATVFSNTVDITLYFFYVGTDLETAIHLKTAGSFGSIYQTYTRTVPPQTVATLQGTDLIELSFSSSSTSPLNVPKGLSFMGSAIITNGTLFNALKWFSFNAKSFQVSADLFIPVFSTPEDITLTIAAGPFALSKTLTAPKVILTVDIPTDITLNVGLVATIQSSTKPQVLDFQLNGQYLIQNEKLTLEGDLTNTWTHPFGLSWLTINSAKGVLVLADDGTQGLSLVANGALSFTNGAVTIEVDFTGANYDNILLEITNIPISKSLQNLYLDITGKPASALQQVNITGTATAVIATYNTGTYQEGFTLQADALLANTGNALKAVRILKSGATSTTFKYDATLYIPIFSTLEADFTLKETGAFEVTSHTSCDDFTLTFDVGSDDKIDIQADLETKLTSQVLQYSAEGDFDSASETVMFTGTLKSPWVHPFSVSWLTLNSGQVSVELGGPEEVQFSISGSASLTFSSTPVTFAAAIGGANLEDDYIAISGIPVSQTLLKDVTNTILHLTPPDVNALVAHGTASIALSTYDAPQAKQGFSFSVNVNIQDTSSSLYKLAHYFSKNPTNLALTFSLYANVFSSTPSAEISLTETGSLPLSASVTAQSLSFDLSISTVSSLSVSTDLAVLFRHQTAPLNFDVSASLTSSPSLTLNGNLAGNWVAPFGQKWLTLTSVSMALSLSPDVTMDSLSLAGAGTFDFGTDTGSASVSFSVSDDFLDVDISATLTNQWTVGSISKAVIGTTPAFLNNIQKSTTDLTTTITLATSSGVTIDVNGKITEDLASSVKKYAYWWSQDVTTLDFDIKVNLPVFSTAPEDISLYITWSEEIKLTDHLWFESVTFDLTVPLSVGLDVKIKAEFNKNPTLIFDVEGQYKADNSIILTGAMEGTWVNPFGIKGFDLSNIIVQFGFNPELCMLDGCISDFGLGSDLSFNNKIIKFDGNVEAPDFFDIFLFGSFSSGSTGMLSVLDVATEWNKINPSAIVPTQLLAPTWGITSASFYFAPENGQFGPITYTEGFGVTGNIILLDMNVYLSLNCTDGAGFSCDFAFETHFDLGVFTDMIKKELGLIYGQENAESIVFSVSQVSVSQWSQQQTAKGVDPKWSLEIVVFGAKNTLEFTMPQYSLQQSFHSFFTTWIKHIFD